MQSKMQKKVEPESWGFTAGRSEARRNGEDPSADGEGKQPISTSSHVFYTEWYYSTVRIPAQFRMSEGKKMGR